jgi:hypothetical protein
MPWIEQSCANTAATLPFSKQKTISSLRGTHHHNSWLWLYRVANVLVCFHRASKSVIALFGMKNLYSILLPIVARTPSTQTHGKPAWRGQQTVGWPLDLHTKQRGRCIGERRTRSQRT